MSPRDTIRFLILIPTVALLIFFDNLYMDPLRLILFPTVFTGLWIAMNRREWKSHSFHLLAAAVITGLALVSAMNRFPDRILYNLILFIAVTAYAAYIYSPQFRGASLMILSLGTVHAGATELYLSLSPYSILLLLAALEEFSASKMFRLPRRSLPSILFLFLFIVACLVSTGGALAPYHSLQTTLLIAAYGV